MAIKKTTKPNNCKNCARAIWNEQFGEYKCGAFHYTVWNPEEQTDCMLHKKLKKNETVKNYSDKEDKE